MGYSMLTRVGSSLVRYTEWVRFPGPSHSWKPMWNESFGTELYNHTADPAENDNVWQSLRGSDVVRELQDRLRMGWRGNHRAHWAL